MNDAVSGLIVAAITAVVVGGIFFWTTRAKKKRIEALRSLCSRRGWAYGYETGPLHQKHALKGESWEFEALSRSSGRESAPGSSDWTHSTFWRSLHEDAGRKTFLLGSRRSGGLDLSQAPSRALTRLFGDEVSGLRALDAGERLSARYILFGNEKSSAKNLFTSISEELLLAWPEKLPLVIRSSPARLFLQVTDKRLEKVEEIVPFIELGESLLNQ